MPAGGRHPGKLVFSRRRLLSAYREADYLPPILVNPLIFFEGYEGVRQDFAATAEFMYGSFVEPAATITTIESVGGIENFSIAKSPQLDTPSKTI